MILSWVNTVFYQQLMEEMRAAIGDGRFDIWAADVIPRVTARS
jgi:queuine tRNA-ribosyltransferase